MLQRILILFLLIWQSVVYSQKLNGYKYVYVPTLKYNDGTIDKWNISGQTIDFFKSAGFEILTDYTLSEVLIKKPCEILYLGINHTNIVQGYNSVTFGYGNCNGQLGTFDGRAMAMSLQADYRNATKKALKEFEKVVLGYYTFDPSMTPKYESDVESYIGSEIDFNDETTVRSYFDKNGASGIEGIWNHASQDASEYKLVLIKDDYVYKAYILEASGFWEPSELKATFEPAAVNTVFTVKWTMGDKKTEYKAVATLENNGIIEFNLPTPENTGSKTTLYKVYPTLNSSSSLSEGRITNEWSGNGSGLIISSSGYIVTNYHVIENSKEIEVEHIYNGEVKTYNAAVIQSDKVNDLAVLKIFDLAFDGLKEEPKYSFSTEMADVGTSVYAYGYPLALSIMGKEIKVTDGIISSKTGFEGDITTYQITAPIQAGSSGGPLFDDKGNLIGINSSGLRKNIADNVGYSIKTAYVKNLLDVLSKPIKLPSYNNNQGLSIIEQVKNISPFVVMVKVKN